MLELVYLWIEGYKNIRRTGFNFTQRFKGNYDELNNQFTFEVSDEYFLEDFYGAGINQFVGFPYAATGL